MEVFARHPDAEAEVLTNIGTLPPSATPLGGSPTLKQPINGYFGIQKSTTWYVGIALLLVILLLLLGSGRITRHKLLKPLLSPWHTLGVSLRQPTPEISPNSLNWLIVERSKPL